MSRALAFTLILTIATAAHAADRGGAAAGPASRPTFASVDAAIEALKSPDAVRQMNAGQWLSTQEPAAVAPALPALVPLLADPRMQRAMMSRAQRTTPGTAAAAAIRHAGPAGVDALVAAFDSPNEVLRANVVFLLARERDGADADKAVAVLTKAAKDPVEAVRTLAADGLARPGSPEAVAALLALSADKTANVRGRAAWALGIAAAKPEPAPKPRSAAKPILSNQLRANVTTRLCALLADDPEADVRNAAAGALGDVKDENAARPLVKALDDKPVRKSAAQALAELGSKQATPGLMKVLDTPLPENAPYDQVRDEDSVRLFAARGIGVATDVRGTLTLTRVLTAAGSSQTLKEQAATALGQIGDRRAVPALIDAIKEPDPRLADAAANRRFPPHERLQAAAARALGEIRDPAAVGPLVAVLSAGTDRGVQEAAWALGELADPAAIDPLVRCLFAAGDNGYQADAAGAALAKIRSPKVVRALIEANLADPKPGYAGLIARRTVDKIAGSGLDFSGKDIVAGWWKEHEAEYR